MAESEFVETILEPEIPIVDPHHHIWMLPDSLLDFLDESDDPDGQAIARTYHLHRRYLIDELLADLTSGHNIRATVFTDAHTMYRASGPDEFKSVGEVEFVNGYSAMAESGIFGDIRFCAGIIGSIDLRLGDRVPEVIEAHLHAGGGRYRGIRPPSTSYDDALDSIKHMLGTPQILLDPEFLKGARHLAPHRLSLDLFVLHTQLPEALHVARNLPDTQIVINHTGGPLGIGPYALNRDEHFRVWREGMAQLAACDNVAVKVGGLGMALCGFPTSALIERAGSEALARDWAPHILETIEMFGANRCLFESNFPVDGVTARYPAIWNTFKRVVSGASKEEKNALFAETAARVYRIEF